MADTLLLACGFSRNGLWDMREVSRVSLVGTVTPVQRWPCAGVVGTKVFDLPDARAWAWNQLLGKNRAPVMRFWVAHGVCSCGWSSGVGHGGRRWREAG